MFSEQKCQQPNINNAPLADSRDIFSGHRAIDGDNAITKDRPRLKRATIVLLHSAIIITHSCYALKANYSDFLLSQSVIKLSLHSVLLFFSNEGDL